MNKDLEMLIDLALADGVLTDKEKHVLFKKAETLGVDQDEFEMVLDAKLHLAQKQTTQANIPQPPVQEQMQEKKSDKFGDMKKCPSCGSPVSSFTTRCQDCGHDFKNVQSNSSINKLFELLNEAERTRSSSTGNIFSMLQSAIGVSDVDKKKMEIISSYPIPTSKDDMLEFLALAAPKTKTIGNFLTKGSSENKVPNQYAEIWKAKCEQIIMKARFAMKEDKKTIEEIEYYTKQIGIK